MSALTTSCPPSLAKHVLAFLQRADELDAARHPYPAYFVRTYAAQLVLKGRDPNDDAHKTFLLAILGSLEDFKKEHAADLASVDGRTVVTRLALTLFARADELERQHQCNAAVCKMFFTASVLFECTKQFNDGVMDTVAAEKWKYGRFIAARMTKCLRDGSVYQSLNKYEGPSSAATGDSDAAAAAASSGSEPQQQPPDAAGGGGDNKAHHQEPPAPHLQDNSQQLHWVPAPPTEAPPSQAPPQAQQDPTLADLSRLQPGGPPQSPPASHHNVYQPPAPAPAQHPPPPQQTHQQQPPPHVQQHQQPPPPQQAYQQPPPPQQTHQQQPPPPPQQTHQQQPPPPVQQHQQPPPPQQAYQQPPAPVARTAASVSESELDRVMNSQKLAKQAIAALQFQDVSTGKSLLQQALAALG